MNREKAGLNKIKISLLESPAGIYRMDPFRFCGVFPAANFPYFETQEMTTA